MAKNPPALTSNEFDYDDPSGRRWRIRLQWAVIDERWEAVEISVGANPDKKGVHRTPVTAEQVRRLPLGTIITEAKREHAAAIRAVAEFYGDPTNEIDAVTERWGPKRGRALTRADLQLVADSYNEAVRTYMPVTEAVAQACNVSRSTAGKRIMAARRAGLHLEEQR